MKKILIIVFATFQYYLLSSYKGIDKDFFLNDLIKIINSNTTRIAKNKIKFDGIYNPYDTSITLCGEKMNKHYITDNFIFFTKNNFAYRSNFVSKDSGAFDKQYFNDEKFNYTATCGVFFVSNDTLTALVPSSFDIGGYRPRDYLTYFQGIIKNEDTILDWKMIKPYPNIKEKFNKSNIIAKSTPHTLYFIKNTAVLSLDTSKIWFNKYKQYEKKN